MGCSDNNLSAYSRRIIFALPTLLDFVFTETILGKHDSSKCETSSSIIIAINSFIADINSGAALTDQLNDYRTAFYTNNRFAQKQPR